jgi:Uma2 family endonuclease
MSTIATKKRTPVEGSVEDEGRWVITDVSWGDYERLAKLLPPSFRLAFDGRNLEIMVAGVRHEMFGWLMMKFAEAVMDHREIDYFPAGRATWQRPEIERGIEADACYLLDPGKLEVAKAAHSKGSNDVADYPNPDLAIEVDISRPKVDRPGIYAEMGVPELWRLNGGTPVIERLGAEARYRPVEVSGWLGVNVAQLRRWVVEEDSSNAREWSRRMQAWVKKTYKRKKRRG